MSKVKSLGILVQLVNLNPKTEGTHKYDSVLEENMFRMDALKNIHHCYPIESVTTEYNAKRVNVGLSAVLYTPHLGGRELVGIPEELFDENGETNIFILCNEYSNYHKSVIFSSGRHRQFYKSGDGVFSYLSEGPVHRIITCVNENIVINKFTLVKGYRTVRLQSEPIFDSKTMGKYSPNEEGDFRTSIELSIRALKEKQKEKQKVLISV